MNYDLLEELSREKLQLAASPAYSIGNALLGYRKKIASGDIKGLVKDIRDNRAARVIRKKYMNHLDRPETEHNQDDTEQKRIVVYTCVLGGYDRVPRHLVKFENVDYVLLTDEPERYSGLSDQYKIQKLSDELLSKGNILANRYVKFHPADLFKGRYDYAIYMDGNLRVMADIRKMIRRVPADSGLAMHNHRERDDIYSEAEVCRLLRRGNPEKIEKQMMLYRNNGFPSHYGMNEATVIVSDLNNPKAEELLDLWWKEFIRSESFRDQLAWPFVLWENNIPIEEIGNLGNDIYKNPLIEICRHAG